MNRFIQVGITVNALAVMGGLIKARERHKTRQVEMQSDLVDHTVLNGNVEKIRAALDSARKLIRALPQNELALREARLIENYLGNALTEMTGFEQLWREIQEVQLWAGVPENMRRWQAWRQKKATPGILEHIRRFFGIGN